jgi:prophage antirepressor-like protein
MSDTLITKHNVANIDSHEHVKKIQTYNELTQTKNILATLIENVNNDSLFLKHISKLKKSDNLIETKKIDTLMRTMNSIRMFGTTKNPLLLATDVGILMGISHIHMLIKKFDPDEKVIGYMKISNNKKKKIIFLTKSGIYRCFFVSRSPLSKLFRKFIINLVEHVVSYESHLLSKIANKFQVDNPELIENGINDLQNRLVEYKKKFIDEQKRSNNLATKCNEIEQENIELDIATSYNIMHIEQLKKEKITV